MIKTKQDLKCYFEKDLKNYQCSTQYLAQKNYGAFLESFEKSFTYSSSSFSELKTLAKIFIKNIVR